MEIAIDGKHAILCVQENRESRDRQGSDGRRAVRSGNGGDPGWNTPGGGPPPTCGLAGSRRRRSDEKIPSVINWVWTCTLLSDQSVLVLVVRAISDGLGVEDLRRGPAEIKHVVPGQRLLLEAIWS